MSYYIRVTYYFFKNTLDAPKNGPLKLDGTIKTFKTKREALEYLSDKGITFKLTANKFTPSGMYHLRHGEYEAPDYQIRKSRNQ
tara:strand:+ start:699 stop:950 length:252 start_codon:yes stop_codon:yes gene_type:complete